MVTADAPPPRTVVTTTAYARDVKRLRKRGKDMARLVAVVDLLRSAPTPGAPAPRPRPHRRLAGIPGLPRRAELVARLQPGRRERLPDPHGHALGHLRVIRTIPDPSSSKGTLPARSPVPGPGPGWELRRPSATLDREDVAPGSSAGGSRHAVARSLSSPAGRPAVVGRSPRGLAHDDRGPAQPAAAVTLCRRAAGPPRLGHRDRRGHL